jgi:hypothetical protein
MRAPVRDGQYRRWVNRLGRHHRRDGPAVEGDNGYKSWHFNGCLAHDEHGNARWVMDWYRDEMLRNETRYHSSPATYQSHLPKAGFQ